jgi:hypothetical protein
MSLLPGKTPKHDRSQFRLVKVDGAGQEVESLKIKGTDNAKRAFEARTNALTKVEKEAGVTWRVEPLSNVARIRWLAGTRPN